MGPLMAGVKVGTEVEVDSKVEVGAEVTKVGAAEEANEGPCVENCGRSLPRNDDEGGEVVGDGESSRSITSNLGSTGSGKSSRLIGGGGDAEGLTSCSSATFASCFMHTSLLLEASF